MLLSLCPCHVVTAISTTRRGCSASQTVVSDVLKGPDDTETASLRWQIMQKQGNASSHPRRTRSRDMQAHQKCFELICEHIIFTYQVKHWGHILHLKTNRMNSFECKHFVVWFLRCNSRCVKSVWHINKKTNIHSRRDFCVIVLFFSTQSNPAWSDRSARGYSEGIFQLAPQSRFYIQDPWNRFPCWIIYNYD